MNIRSITKFINICKLSQSELLHYLFRFCKRYYELDKIHKSNDYLFIEGDIPVLLVAHLDTVHKNKPKEFWISLDCEKVMASEGIGGDDRCGVYLITRLIKTKFKPYVLFTTDEEVGLIGAEKFCDDYETIDVNCIIELDRKGKDDVVAYDDENRELCEKFISIGFNEANGSLSDISVLCPNYQISGVNLSCGYYNAHTADEYVVFKDMNKTYYRVLKFLNNPDNYNHKYIYKPSFNFPCLYYYENICMCCNSKLNNYEYYELPDGYLCHDCFSQFEEYFTICPNCGTCLYNDTNYCEVCGSYIEEGEDKNE